MLVKISWKNIWRSKTRSLVVIMAVALGLWAGIFTSSFMYGISNQRMKGVIDSQISHIQIHFPGFTEDFESALLINNSAEIMAKLDSMPTVKSASARLIATGMIASPSNGSGVMIKGIVPEQEKNVTNVHSKLIEGDYFEENKKNAILIGEKLAKKLSVKLRSKVVLNMQDINGNITAGAFRVSGIFKTNSAKYDEGNVFVKKEDLSKLLGCGESLHEIAIVLNSWNEVDTAAGTLKTALTGLEVKSWKNIVPELDLIDDMMDEYLHIFMAIILLAMAFGIINTMLMAILERVKEIGMLMAIGMNKFRIFMMILLETVFLTFTGAPVGVLLGMLSINYLGKTGVDLALFSEGLANFDLDSVVYPALDYSFYPTVILMVIITSVLSAIYPASKALSLNPATAVRSA